MNKNIFNIKRLLERMRVQYAFFLSVVIIFSGVILSYYTAMEESSRDKDELIQRAKVLAENISAASIDYMLENNFSSLEQVLVRTVKYPDVERVQVVNGKGEFYGDVKQGKDDAVQLIFSLQKIEVPAENNVHIETNNNNLTVWSPINNGELLGWVRMIYSLDSVNNRAEIVLYEHARDYMIATVLIVVFIFVYLRRPVRAIESYTLFATGLVENKGGKVIVNDQTIELKRLGDALNHVSDRLYMQSQALRNDFRELERLAVIPENSPNLIITLNKNYRIEYLNNYAKSYLRQYGLPESELFIFLPGNVEKIIDDCLSNNQSIRDCEASYIEKSFLWSFAPVIDQGVVHCFGVDISKRIMAENNAQQALVDKLNAEGANEAKSAFLANMSHEIRTPLTSIIGFSESLLESGQSMQERVESINIVIRNAKHLLVIVNDILDLTKIEADKMQIESFPFSLFDITEDIDSIFRVAAVEKGLSFELNYHFPLPDKLVSDPVRIKQVLMNLCSNAVKFTRAGRVVMDVMFDRKAARLNFKVQDTGIGLDQRQITKLFTPFEQADSSTSREFGGTGLGLHISRLLADRLNGGIDIKSEPGVGSTFDFYVYCGHMEEDNLLLSVNHLSEQPSNYNVDTTVQLGGHVLLVEDSVDNQRLISMYIRKTGAPVSIANNGQEAVEMVSKHDYDLVLMDMQMPMMDGIEATRLIRKNGYKGVIVMLTANVMKEDIQRCLDSGCNDYFSKPINRAEFNQLLFKYLKQDTLVSDIEEPLISDLVKEGPEFVELVKSYAEQLPDLMNNIKEKYAAGDLEALKKLVHNMKGTGGNLGYIVLSEMCAELEFSIAKNERQEIENYLEKLDKIKNRIMAGVT